MELRPDPEDESSNIVVYESDREAEFVLYRTNKVRKTLEYLGLVDLGPSSRRGVESLDNGEIKSKETTNYLQKLAQKFGRFSVDKVASPYSWVQDEVDQSEAVVIGLQNYLANRIPVQFNVLKRESPQVPSPVKHIESAAEKAKREKVDELIEPQAKKTRRRIGQGLGVSAVLAGIGEAFYFTKIIYSGNKPLADKVFTPDFLHHTNDFINAAGIVAGSTIIYALKRAWLHGRDEGLYRQGWNAAVERLDPDGFIEAALNLPEDTVTKQPHAIFDQANPET